MSAVEMVSQRATLAERLRLPFVGLAGGLLAGLLGAINARLLMRVVAVAMGGRGGFSVEGTSVIFGFAALIGPLLGLLFIGVRRWLPGNRLAQGLIFAALLALGFQLPIFQIVPDFREEVMAAGALGLSVFLLINVVFCVVLALITGGLDRQWASLGQNQIGITIGTVVLGLMALAGAGVLMYQLGGRLIGVVD
jgi:hypothetical protein